VGNLGACARKTNLDIDINIVIISNKIISSFDLNNTDPFIKELEKRLNQDNSPYRRVKFLSEANLIQYFERRLKLTNDATLSELINKYKESKKQGKQQALF
jgi:ribosomal protein S6